jgi:tetratricopeptide (TPR) repeat protein
MRTNTVISLAFSAVLVLSGCNRHAPVVSLPPGPVANSGAGPLDQADRAFNAGNYDSATRAYEDYLRLNPRGTQRDQALFHLGVAYVLRPAPDWQRASSAFRQIVEGFPVSPFKGPSNLILSLHSELDQLNLGNQQRDQRIKQLTTELDRLKRIDADRRKRP